MGTKAKPRHAQVRNTPTFKGMLQSKGFRQGLRLLSIAFTSGLLGYGRLLGSCYPFGLGFAGSFGGGWESFAGLIGVAVGSIALSPTPHALRCTAAAMLIFALNMGCYGTKTAEKPPFRPICVMLSVAVTGYAYLSAAGWNRETLLLSLWELLLSGVSCWMFSDVGKKRPAAILFLSLGFVCTFETIYPQFGGFLAVFITLLATRGGAYTGTLTGALLGMGVGLVSGDSALCIVLALSGMVAGSVSQQSRLLRLAVFPSAGWLITKWFCLDGETWKLLCLAAVMGSLLPESLFLRIEGTFGLKFLQNIPISPASAESVKYLLEEQATAFRTLFRHIYDSVERGEPPEFTGMVTQRTQERLCQSCQRHDECWKREGLSTTQTMNHALSKTLERGRAMPEDFGAFRRQCPQFDRLLAIFNEEMYCFWHRRQYRARRKQHRLAVCRQYAQLSGLLDSAAQRLGEPIYLDRPAAARGEYAAAQLGCEVKCIVRRDSRGRHTLELRGEGLERLNTKKSIELLSAGIGVPMETADILSTAHGQRLIFRQCPPLMVTTAAASKQKREGEVSGDNGVWFRDSLGVLWVILCDGMGSGEPAAGESRLLMTLLKDFLHAGIPPEAALTTLTGALSLRGEIDGGFTTVDLLKIDLFTGHASLHKLGSAPTYFRKNGSVSRITGNALPAGLELDRETVPDSSHFTVSDGDMLLLVTDGITDGSNDAWLRTLLTRYRGESPRELAKTVISSPSAGREDDRTVVAVRIGKRV